MIGFMVLLVIAGIMLYSCIRMSSMAERRMEALNELHSLRREKSSGGYICKEE